MKGNRSVTVYTGLLKSRLEVSLLETREAHKTVREITFLPFAFGPHILEKAIVRLLKKSHADLRPKRRKYREKQNFATHKFVSFIV